MFHDNHFYGHAEILQTYCDADIPFPIVPGRLQHGWQPHYGVTVDNLTRWHANFIWSNRNVKRCNELGNVNAVPIGAPFIYLDMGDNIQAKPDSLLVFPFHGWEKQKILGDFNEYAQSLLILQKEHTYKHITVCLYWSEYDVPELRNAFERHGFNVVTMGHRENNLDFLYKQQKLIYEHEHVSANRITTAVFYALYCDRPTFIYGPIMGIDKCNDPTGEVFDSWQKESFPQLMYNSFHGQSNKTIGDYELGVEFKLSKHDMIELFYWDNKYLPKRLATLGRAKIQPALNIPTRIKRLILPHEYILK